MLWIAPKKYIVMTFECTGALQGMCMCEDHAGAGLLDLTNGSRNVQWVTRIRETQDRVQYPRQRMRTVCPVCRPAVEDIMHIILYITRHSLQQ